MNDRITHPQTEMKCGKHLMVRHGEQHVHRLCSLP